MSIFSRPLTLWGARRVLDNINYFLYADYQYADGAVRKIGENSKKDANDVERLKRMFKLPYTYGNSGFYVSKTAESYLTEEQKIDGYIAVLEDNKIQFPKEVIGKLGDVSKRGNQKVVDALLKVNFNEKEVARALGKVANIGDRRVINVLIGMVRSSRGWLPAARDSLMTLAEKGDQQVIEGLLPFVHVIGVDFFIRLGASKDQIFRAVLEDGDMFLLEDIVFNGGLIDSDDKDRLTKIEKAKARLINAYVDELDNAILLHRIDETLQRFVNLAGKENPVAVSSLRQKLMVKLSQQGKYLKEGKYLVKALGEVSKQGNAEVLDSLHSLLERVFNANNDDVLSPLEDALVAIAIEATLKIGGERQPAWIQDFIDMYHLQGSLKAFCSVSYVPSYSLASWKKMSEAERALLKKITHLIMDKVRESGVEQNDPWFALNYSDVDDAIRLFNRDGDFKVIYHPAKWEGVSTSDGVVTIGGSRVAEHAIVEIVSKDVMKPDNTAHGIVEGNRKY